MTKDNVIDFKKPEPFIDDPITDILRGGTRQLLAKALEVEISSFLSQYADLSNDQCRKRITRNGYLPERKIQIGIGQVLLKVPRVRDRQPKNGSGRIRFSSAILPPYLRKTKSMEMLIPWLYLKGISTGDFTEALAALVGKDALGLSPSTSNRLKVEYILTAENSIEAYDIAIISTLKTDQFYHNHLDMHLISVYY